MDATRRQIVQAISLSLDPRWPATPAVGYIRFTSVAPPRRPLYIRFCLGREPEGPTQAFIWELDSTRGAARPLGYFVTSLKTEKVDGRHGLFTFEFVDVDKDGWLDLRLFGTVCPPGGTWRDDVAVSRVFLYNAASHSLSSRPDLDNCPKPEWKSEVILSSPATQPAISGDTSR